MSSSIEKKSKLKQLQWTEIDTLCDWTISVFFGCQTFRLNLTQLKVSNKKKLNLKEKTDFLAAQSVEYASQST